MPFGVIWRGRILPRGELRAIIAGARIAAARQLPRESGGHRPTCHMTVAAISEIATCNGMVLTLLPRVVRCNATQREEKTWRKTQQAAARGLFDKRCCLSPHCRAERPRPFPLPSLTETVARMASSDARMASVVASLTASDALPRRKWPTMSRRTCRREGASAKALRAETAGGRCGASRHGAASHRRLRRTASAAPT